ncbi:MAG TPA: PEP/pyruvate-binding domain-containing protein [Ktedonobacteraceae bacterium]|nr:PEP/pyruvate-binding domain-containing protein [Ktedonobacteraceae bacterium]
MDIICNLADVKREHVALVGGKAANLGVLIQAELPVPPGFVLLTTAYRCFVEANGLAEEIERLAQRAAQGTLEQLEEGAGTIGKLFEQGAVPGELQQALVGAYRALGAGAVAVRSSATAEDMAGASFAGQQETYLNVQGEERLLAAVRRCWASLWTARAMAYREQKGIGAEQVSIAVIVQQMVQAEASGILFTVNPLTGAGNEMVINAAWGLGEAVVGGRVNPDSVRVEKATGKAIQIVVGDKEVMTVATAAGMDEIAVEHERRRQQVLTPEQVAVLARMGREIEELLSGPQDIEWAIVGGGVCILQARPVSTIASVEGFSHDEKAIAAKIPVPPGDDTWDSADILPAQPFDLWTRTNVGENLPFPITPLTSTGFPALFQLDKQQQEGAQGQGARRFYGRLYINEGLILHNMVETFGIPPSFVGMIWGSHRKGKMQVPGKWRPLRLLLAFPKLLGQGFGGAQKGPKLTPQEFFAQIDSQVNEFLQKDLRQLDDKALWAEGLPTWGERGAAVFATNIRISTPAGLTLSLLERVVGWWTKRKELVPDLVASLPGIYSAEVGPMLWRMAQTLRKLNLSAVALDNSSVEALATLQAMPEAKPFHEQLTAFLERHGHRCPNEVEFLKPRWMEAPEQVIELVANYLRAGEDINPIAAEMRQRERREAAVTQIEAKLDPLRRRIFRSLLKRTQQAVPVRDNSRYYTTKFLLPTRLVFAELGRRWAERGWLAASDDIFFLTAKEIEAIVKAGTPTAVSEELVAFTAKRRIAYDYWFTVVPADVIGPDGKPVIEEEENGQVLEGIPVSGGKVSGRARIVLDPREAATLRAGEILVTQATDPGWTPVFPLVSGLVLEIGGQISHGAIVAREYGLPAVVNVIGATRTIKDGQVITVDGTNGRVLLEENPTLARRGDTCYA